MLHTDTDVLAFIVCTGNYLQMLMVSLSATLRRVYRNRRKICIGGWCALSFVGLVSMSLIAYFLYGACSGTDLERFGGGWLYVSLRHTSPRT